MKRLTPVSGSYPEAHACYLQKVYRNLSGFFQVYRISHMEHKRAALEKRKTPTIFDKSFVSVIQEVCLGIYLFLFPWYILHYIWSVFLAVTSYLVWSSPVTNISGYQPHFWRDPILRHTKKRGCRNVGLKGVAIPHHLRTMNWQWTGSSDVAWRQRNCRTEVEGGKVYTLR